MKAFQKIGGFFKSPKKPNNTQQAHSPGEDFDGWYKSQFAGVNSINGSEENIEDESNDTISINQKSITKEKHNNTNSSKQHEGNAPQKDSETISIAKPIAKPKGRDYVNHPPTATAYNKNHPPLPPHEQPLASPKSNPVTAANVNESSTLQKSQPRLPSSNKPMVSGRFQHHRAKLDTYDIIDPSRKSFLIAESKRLEKGKKEDNKESEKDSRLEGDGNSSLNLSASITSGNVEEVQTLGSVTAETDHVEIVKVLEPPNSMVTEAVVVTKKVLEMDDDDDSDLLNNSISNSLTESGDSKFVQVSQQKQVFASIIIPEVHRVQQYSGQNDDQYVSDSTSDEEQIGEEQDGEGGEGDIVALLQSSTGSKAGTTTSHEYKHAMAELQKKLDKVTLERDEARATCVRLCHEASHRDCRALTDNSSDALLLNHDKSFEMPQKIGLASSLSSSSSLLKNNTNRPLPTFSKAFEELLGYQPDSRTPESKTLMMSTSPKRIASPKIIRSKNKKRGASKISYNTTNMQRTKRTIKASATPIKTTNRLIQFAENEVIFEGKENENECHCRSKTRLVGLMRQHETVHQRLRAVMKQLHSIEKRHAEELTRVRKAASKGPEAAIKKLELQNASLRRIIMMAQSQMDVSLASSFTSNPSVPPPIGPPPIGPPPVRTGRRRNQGGNTAAIDSSSTSIVGTTTSSRKYHFSVTKQAVTEVGFNDGLNGSRLNDSSL